MNQSVSFPTFKPLATPTKKLTIDAPANPLVVPPGHYMLFLLNKDGPPSVARIIRLKPKPKPVAPSGNTTKPVAIMAPLSTQELDENIRTEQARPHVAVGLTPVCPYGLGPCWGGAYEALKGISDIDVVRPIPSQDDSVAFVYLREDVLPDIDVWRSEFQETANGSYHMRGIELTLSGRVTEHDKNLVMEKTPSRPEVSLEPFHASSKIEYHAKSGTQKAHSDEEAGAYGKLAAVVARHANGVDLQVTSRLQKHGPNKFSLDVRGFEIADGA